MEPRTTGKTKERLRYRTAKLDDIVFRLFEIIAIDHHKRRATFVGETSFTPVEHHLKATIFRKNVVVSIGYKLPAKHLFEKETGRLQITAGYFDMINAILFIHSTHYSASLSDQQAYSLPDGSEK